MQEPYGEHNMQPKVMRHSRQPLLSETLLRQAVLEFNSRAPTLAANEEMHTLLKKHTSTGMSYNARRRLEEMEVCGLAGKNYRKSVQVEQRMSQNLGLTGSGAGSHSARYKRHLETTNVLNRTAASLK